MQLLTFLFTPTTDPPLGVDLHGNTSSDADRHELYEYARLPEMKNYKLIKVLGYGSMGTVFLACLQHPESRSHTLFALKVMSKEELGKKGSSKRAAMEREVLSSCVSGLQYRSPFLPFLQDHFQTDKHEVLVMDYCPGGDLNGLRQTQPGKRFSEATARFYGAEIVLALEHLHRLGFVYRDLKPENVLLQTTGHIMLADFDLCLKLEPDPPNNRGILMSAPRADGVDHDHVNANKALRPKHKMSCLGRYNLISSIASCVAAEATASTRISKPKPKPSKPPPNACTKAKVTPVLQAATSAYKNLPATGRSLSFVGTEEYVAPEILWGTGHDLAVDWWTLGVLLYELVFGITPFKSLSRKETFFNILCKEPKLDHFIDATDDDHHGHHRITPLLHDLIAKLLAKQPSQRLGSKAGAQEIKSHPFFQGVCWDSLHQISNPPYVPSTALSTLKDIIASSSNQHREDVNFLENHLSVAERRRRAERSGASTSREGVKNNEKELINASSSQEDSIGKRLTLSFSSYQNYNILNPQDEDFQVF